MFNLFKFGTMASIKQDGKEVCFVQATKITPDAIYQRSSDENSNEVLKIVSSLQLTFSLVQNLMILTVSGVMREAKAPEIGPRFSSSHQINDNKVKIKNQTEILQLFVCDQYHHFTVISS